MCDVLESNVRTIKLTLIMKVIQSTRAHIFVNLIGECVKINVKGEHLRYVRAKRFSL